MRLQNKVCDWTVAQAFSLRTRFRAGRSKLAVGTGCAERSDCAGENEMRMRDVIMLSLGFVFGIMTAWSVLTSLVA